MRFLVIAALGLILAACPSHRTIITPKIPHNGDSRALASFEKAQQKFLRDGHNREDFEKIVEEFPEDPIVPHAHLYAGMASLKDRKWGEAIASLDQAAATSKDAALTQRIQLFLGIAKNYAGDPTAALPLLQRGAGTAQEGEERLEWLAAMAYATAAASDRPLASLDYFDKLYPKVSPTERALIVARTQEVVAAAPPDALAKTLEELSDKKGPGTAAAASRLALVEEAADHTAEAQKLRALAGPARAAVGLPKAIQATSAPTSSVGTPGLIGAVVPYGQKIGEQAIAGVTAASAGGSAIEIRGGADASATEVAVESLGRANVIAIVGQVDGDTVDAAAKRAEALGVPLLSLEGRPEGQPASRWVFHMRHSAEARARLLAHTAIAKGVKTFAVMRPESGYGEAVADAFIDQLKKDGGTLVNTVTYPKDQKSYAAYGAKLGGGWQGLFIADKATQLGLIVPAVTAAKHIPQPIGTKKVQGGRPIVLLSTAEGLAPDYLAAAGRHSEGALFAPGFYPDDTDPTQKPFLDRFTQLYGRAPNATEAYAYDAAQLAATGATGRVALVAALPNAQLAGVTGTITFDANHLRADPGVLYTVVNDGSSYAIRVAK